MEKSNSSNSLGVCEKLFRFIRASPAVQAIRRISSHSREPTPTKPASAQHHSSGPTHNHATKTIEIHSEAADHQHATQPLLQAGTHRQQAPTKAQAAKHNGMVPVNFTSNNNLPPITNHDKTISPTSSSSVNGNVTKVGQEDHGRLAGNVLFPEKHSHDKRKIKDLDQLTAPKKGVKGFSEQMSHGVPPADLAKSASKGINEGQEKGGNEEDKRPPGGVVADLNETFSNYINRAKLKIRSVSDVKDKSSLELAGGAHQDTNYKRESRDHFSDYIRRAKSKMRSTSFGSAKNTSFKRE